MSTLPPSDETLFAARLKSNPHRMKTNPTPSLEPPGKPPSKLRFATTLNLCLCLFWTISTASQALNYDLNLQNPTTRLSLFLGSLAAVLFGILALQERLEQRIATLLDRLEQKGVLSTEERAAIGIVPPKIIEVAGLRRALIVAAVVVLALVLLFYFAT